MPYSIQDGGFPTPLSPRIRIWKIGGIFGWVAIVELAVLREKAGRQMKAVQ
jgi:hypothetical protein